MKEPFPLTYFLAISLPKIYNIFAENIVYLLQCLRFDWINREEESFVFYKPFIYVLQEEPFVFYKPFIYVLQIIDLYATDEWFITHKSIVYLV